MYNITQYHSVSIVSTLEPGVSEGPELGAQAHHQWSRDQVMVHTNITAAASDGDILETRLQHYGFVV